MRFLLVLLCVALGQELEHGKFCQSNLDCLDKCCYKFKCRSTNTCNVYNLVLKSEEVSTCVIGDHCESGCCLNRKCSTAG